MKLTTKQLTLCAVLTAMALALSYLENFFPLSLAIPIPGVKLGLANIVTVFALYVLGPGQAMLILIGRCVLGAVFAGLDCRQMLPELLQLVPGGLKLGDLCLQDILLFFQRVQILGQICVLQHKF